MTNLSNRPSISLHSVVVASSEQISADLGDEALILGVKTGSYYGFDQVGLFIWNLLQAPRLVSDIRDAILEEYEVKREECEQDLLAFLDELAAKFLINVVNEPNP